MICLFYNDCGDLMMGDFNGMVYVWGDGGNKIINFIKYGYDVWLLFILFIKFEIFFIFLFEWYNYNYV